MHIPQIYFNLLEICCVQRTSGCFLAKQYIAKLNCYDWIINMFGAKWVINMFSADWIINMFDALRGYESFHTGFMSTPSKYCENTHILYVKGYNQITILQPNCRDLRKIVTWSDH